MLWRALHKYYPYVLPGVAAAVTAWAWFSWRRKAACDSPGRRNSGERRARACDGGAVAAETSRSRADPDPGLAAKADPLGPDRYHGAPSPEACVGPSAGDAGGASSAAKSSGVSPEVRDGVPAATGAAAGLSAGARDGRPGSLAASLKGNVSAEQPAIPVETSAPKTLTAADASHALPATDSIAASPASASTDGSKTRVGDGPRLVNNSDALPKAEKSSTLLPNNRKASSNSTVSRGSDAAEHIPQAAAAGSQSPALLDSPVTAETNARPTAADANGSSATLEAGEALTSPDASNGKREMVTDACRAAKPARQCGSRRAGVADSTVANAGTYTAATNCGRDAPFADASTRAASVNCDVGESAQTLRRSELRCQNGDKCEAKAAADGKLSTDKLEPSNERSVSDKLETSAGKMVNDRSVSEGAFSKDGVGSGAALHKADQAAMGGCDGAKLSGSQATKECVVSCEVSVQRAANDCGERCDPEGSDKVDPLCLKTEMGGKLSRENCLGGSGKDVGDDDRFIQEADALHVKDTNAVCCPLPFETLSCSNEPPVPPVITSAAAAGAVKCDSEISGSVDKTVRVPVSRRKEPEERSPSDKTTCGGKARHNGDDAASREVLEEQFASGFVDKLFEDVRTSFQNRDVRTRAARESDDRPLVSSRLSAEAAPFTPTAVEAAGDKAASAAPPRAAASPVDAAREEPARDCETAAVAPPNNAKGKGDESAAESPSLVKSNLSPEAPPFLPTLAESLPAADKPSAEQQTAGGESVSDNARSAEDSSKSLPLGVNVKESERSPKKGKSSSKVLPSLLPEGKWLLKDRTPERPPKKKSAKSAECVEKNSTGGGGAHVPAVVPAAAPAVVPVENCTRGDPEEIAVVAVESVANGLSTGSEDSESRLTLDDFNAEGVSDGSCPSVTVSSDGSEMVIWEFHVSKILVGRLIGKQGKFINYLKEGSGAKIYIMEVPYTSDFQITHIEGTSEQVDAALNLIRKKFKNLNMNNIAASMPPQIGHVVVPVAPVPIPQGISVDVTVPWFDAYGNLFLQQYTHPTFHALDSLDQALNACYSQPSLPPLLPPLNADTVCAALLEGHWYRAQIMEYYPGSNEVEVKCLDYGGYYKILASDLRQLRSDFLTLPFQASLVYFANLAPLPGHTCYTEEALIAVNKLTLGAHLIAQVTRYDTSSQLPFVNLWLIKDGQSQMINKMLVDAGHAQWLS